LDAACRYADLLCTTGVERGLMGPREPARIWTRHLLNGAALAEFLPPGARVLDIGSGAGLPGIPLALARPGLHVTLVEPMLRRATFCTEVVTALGLDAVQVLRARAEQVQPGEADAVVVRAVAPLARLVVMALPLLRRGGALFALKGESAAGEVDAALDQLRTAAATATVHQIGAGSARTFVVEVRTSAEAVRSAGVRPVRRRSKGVR
jgi:16S rRNA (guanine527-N7)-methyltransferase